MDRGAVQQRKQNLPLLPPPPPPSARILSFHDESGRYVVRLQDGTRAKLKGTNLAPPELFDAIRSDNMDRCLEVLSAAGAAATAMVNGAIHIEEDEDGVTASAGLVSPLLLAILLKRLPIVNLLLQRGASFTWGRPHNGFTATHTAALGGWAAALRVLAEFGANIDTPKNDGVTPAWLAAMHGHAEAVRLLAELGANLETPDINGVTPAYIAAAKGRTDVLRVLAELGANLETPRNTGTTPVWVAAEGGHAELVRLLAELGASVETPGVDGTTPAFIAAQKNRAEVVRVLGELGANLETPRDSGATPAYIAAQEGNREALVELVKARPHLMNQPVTIPGCPPVSPLAIAVIFGNREVAQSLLMLGAPVSVENLKQQHMAPADARKLRAELLEWADTALAQHRTLQTTFLFGCSAHDGIALSMLGGVEGERERIGEFVGVLMGVKLRRMREVKAGIEAVAWQEVDQP